MAEINEIRMEEMESASGGAGGDYVIYTVKKGDNLTKIARKYNVTWQDLARWNSIPNPNLIYPGQQLKIYV